MAANHGKEDDTRAPQISLRTDVLEAFYELWGCVTRRTACCCQLFTRLVHVTQSKVDHFEIQLLVEQQIFRLNIPVHNPQLAQISQRGNKLLEKLASFLFLQLVL